MSTSLYAECYNMILEGGGNIFFGQMIPCTVRKSNEVFGYGV